MELRPPRGMRDFMPEQMGPRKRAVELVERIFRKYGYEPLETPALENMEVLNLKCGEDTDKQIYRVEDGKLGMRFDLTVPLARVVAGNPSLPKPFKRYCIGMVWRREEPQKGRYREFMQADIDVVGSARSECEAELIACACECLSELGFKEFKVRMNNRKVLDALIRKLGIVGNPGAVFRALDKIEKIGESGVRGELEKAGLGKKETDALIGMISERGNNDSVLKRMDGFGGKEGADELRAILELCKIYGIENVSIDLSLVRGLDYYTGPVFEISAGEGIGSIAGGGRYDNLIAGYGGGDVPAVGISLGIERIMALLDRGEKEAPVGIFVAAAKPEFYPNALKAAQELRKGGLNVAVDLMARNLRKQFDYANSKGIRFMGIIGQKEKEKGMITLRNLSSGEERMIPVKDVRDAVGS